MSIRDIIASYLVKVIPKGTAVDLRVPPALRSDSEGGDENQDAHYATSVAFKLAKEKKANPREAPEEIVFKLLKTAPPEFFDRIEVAGPGFVNFWLSQKTLNGELQRVIKENKKYGASNILKNNKIQLEFISANPTGPLTLANGRGGFLGDVIGNVLKTSAAKVEKEYYVNDTGNQVLTLGKSILATRGIIKNEENFYKGGYVAEWAKKNAKLATKMKSRPMELGERAAKDFLKTIKTVIGKKSGIKFDRYTSEKKIHQMKLPEKALEIFKKGGWVYESKGAVWLKTTAFGDDKDRVLITSEGIPTYFLADAGHYLETKKRGFSAKINILGPDHYGYVKRIQAVADILKFDKSEIIITQIIRLMRDGQEFKMSKRKGEFVTFDDLVKEVGADSVRFFFLMIAPETHMDFDMGLAKERSNKNPVFYLQYAYVRCQSILRKSKIQISNSKQDLKLLNTEADVKLIRTLARFPEIIADTAEDYQVHRLTRYALDLAHDFHNFYEKERIIGEAKDIAAARYVLVKAAAIVFENLLDILGISKPKKM